MFYVGQKVVCVNANPHPTAEWDDDGPVNGRIYTVAAVYLTPFGRRPAISLLELKRSQASQLIWKHNGYGQYRFRPIVERKTDISVFKKMLLGDDVNA